ncbi:MAG: efflux RND transporter periplasmic adaptor subunit [Anaerolineae bacterium]|jgi:HlyD family secretion protein
MKRRRIWIIGTIVLLLTTGGGYFAYTRTYLAQAQEPEEPTMETATVIQGDIVLTADGSGELIPAEELELSFRTGGRLAEVLVKTGDQVAEGDLLARLETDSLERAVAEADVELQIAQLELADVREGPSEAELADAEAKLRDAQAGLTLAYDAYQDTADSDDSAADAAKENYDWWVSYYQGQKAKYEAGNLSQADHDWAMAAMIQADEAWQRAVNNVEVAKVQAWRSVEQAQNAVTQAEEDLGLLKSEPLTDTLVVAEFAVDEALLAHEEAKADLEEAQLYAPFDGTVMDVAAEPEDQVGTSTGILTLADMHMPLLQFWLEESDMGNVAAGNQVNVTFEALPGYTFTGTLVRVDPVLVTVSGTTAVQSQARLNLGDQDVKLLSGMTADVEVVSAETRNALLVPVEAPRACEAEQTSEGGYCVSVVKTDGTLETRAVEVGLEDAVNVEILSGLELGETVRIDG